MLILQLRCNAPVSSILKVKFLKSMSEKQIFFFLDIGADVLDVTNENVLLTSSTLEEEETFFELSPNQRNYYLMMQRYSAYLKDQYHSLHKLLWKTGYMVGLSTSRPEREIKPEATPDACRIHGSLEINRVAGNFHITAGK